MHVSVEPLFAIYCTYIGLQFLGFRTISIALNRTADALIFTSLHFHPITHNYGKH